MIRDVDAWLSGVVCGVWFVGFGVVLEGKRVLLGCWVVGVCDGGLMG